MYLSTFGRKFIRIFLLCLTFLSFLTISVYAHPGRLDSNGGHHDRSDGSYHYHDGNSSGRNRSNSKTTTKKYNYDYGSTQKKTADKKETDDSPSFWVLLGKTLMFIIPVPFIVFVFKIKITKKASAIIVALNTVVSLYASCYIAMDNGNSVWQSFLICGIIAPISLAMIYPNK